MGSWLFKNWKYEVSLCWQGRRQRCTWSRARWSESVLVAGPPARNITRKKLSMWRNVIWARTSIFWIILLIIVISTQYLRYWGDMVENMVEENGDLSPRPIFQNVSPNVIINAILSLSQSSTEIAVCESGHCVSWVKMLNHCFWLIPFNVMQCNVWRR